MYSSNKPHLNLKCVQSQLRTVLTPSSVHKHVKFLQRHQNQRYVQFLKRRKNLRYVQFLKPHQYLRLICAVQKSSTKPQV